MSAPARAFEDTKAEGTQAEWLLLDLLTAHGWTVAPNQANWDLGAEGSAARAFTSEWDCHLPDLDAMTPAPRQRVGFEVKSKEPLRMDGGFGWDHESFRRAERWQAMFGAPVIYAIRDRSIAPLPPGPIRRESEPDNMDAWCFASLHRLRLIEPKVLKREVRREDDTPRITSTLYWPRDAFLPLSDLLNADCFRVAPVLVRSSSGRGTRIVL